MTESKLVARPLTEKQRIALLAVARGGIRVVERVGQHGAQYYEMLAPGGHQIGGQFAALKRRGFVCWKRGPALTIAGAFELYFDVSLLDCPADADCLTTCCCGDLVEHHGMGSGHSPVPMHDYYCEGRA